MKMILFKRFIHNKFKHYLHKQQQLFAQVRTWLNTSPAAALQIQSAKRRHGVSRIINLK
jgi:hypothetical protein